MIIEVEVFGCTSCFLYIFDRRMHKKNHVCPYLLLVLNHNYQAQEFSLDNLQAVRNALTKYISYLLFIHIFTISRLLTFDCN